MLFDPAVHERLVESPWDDRRVHDAVAAIVADAESAFDEATLTWPVHEEDGEDAAGWRTIYLGGGGVVWALHRLGSGRDWAPVAQALVRQYAAEPDFGEPHASLWMGESGLLLVEEVVAGGADLDRLATLVGANAENEARETMWGAPGTMLAAQFLHARTGEPRWSRLWDESADSLLAAREPDGFWLQRLYGHEVHYVGPVHGFAGNILALRWRRDVDREAVAAATRIAQREDGLAQWPPALEPPSRRQSVRTQFCHGAPGMVAALAAVAPDDEEWTRLLVEGGELTWQAGPLAKGPGLCHGTAGNGYAFLKLLERTGDELWLRRARAFAMHCVEQVEQWRTRHGQGRYTLWTGDVGTALFLRGCLELDASLPFLELF